MVGFFQAAAAIASRRRAKGDTASHASAAGPGVLVLRWGMTWPWRTVRHLVMPCDTHLGPLTPYVESTDNAADCARERCHRLTRFEAHRPITLSPRADLDDTIRGFRPRLPASDAARGLPEGQRRRGLTG